MKTPPPIQMFLGSAGLLFLVTAVAKFVSASGTARILHNSDPVLGMPFRTVFWIVGGIEIVVGTYCFFGKRTLIRSALVAWLTTSFVAYRIGLQWIGYQKPCSCLGNLTDALHISPETADTAMKAVLGYLLIGSYASLIWLWRQTRRFESTSSAGGTATAAI